jgi:trafficking protein particle complex subunit 2
VAANELISIQNNPLHISLFPPEARDELEFSFLLSSCLDIFEMRMQYKTADSDFGLLQAVDERLAMYGWLTNTGVKFVIVVDMFGRPVPEGSKMNAALGLRDADLKPVCSNVRTSYSILEWLIRCKGFQSTSNSIHWFASQSIL